MSTPFRLAKLLEDAGFRAHVVGDGRTIRYHLDDDLVEHWAHVSENVPDNPKLIVIRVWNQDPPPMETRAQGHALEAANTVAALLAWLGLPTDLDIDLAWSPLADMWRPVVHTRAFVRLKGLIPPECQAALNAQMEAEGGGLPGEDRHCGSLDR